MIISSETELAWNCCELEVGLSKIIIVQNLKTIRQVLLLYIDL